LLAAGPHPSLGAHADTYGRVIGRWTGEVENHVLAARASIDIHFAWVLDGRAVQDTWITPARADRKPGALARLDWYGTTLRVFDPASQSWRVIWWNPVTQGRVELEGRRQGDDIVQLGTRQGQPIKWTFTDITAHAFTWRGYVLEFDGVTWKLEVEISARRGR
jgi:hypothetical protein